MKSETITRSTGYGELIDILRKKQRAYDAACVAGLETAFKYNQKSGDLKTLTPRIKFNMRKAEDALSFYDNGSQDVTGELKKINGELDKQLTEIYEQAVELDFDLASKVERALLAGRREEAD